MNSYQSTVQEFIEHSDNAFDTIIFEEDTFDDNFDAFDVRDAFLEFTCSIMKNYDKYWINNI